MLDFPGKAFLKTRILFQTYEKNKIQRSNNWELELTTRRKLFHKSGRMLPDRAFKRITVHTENDCDSKKFLVYRCDSSTLCGGIGDRQKGIVSMFLMALLSDRVFIINVTHPCKMENVQPSNAYNWSKCKYFLETIPVEDIYEYNYIDDNGTFFLEGIQNFNFSTSWTKRATVLRLNAFAIDGIRLHKHTKRKLSWLLNISNEEAIHLVLHTLFKPSRRMLNDATNFYTNQIFGKHLVCSHIRKGKNPSIPNDSELLMATPNETVVFEFLKRYDFEKSHAIYIASDSNGVKLLAKRQLQSLVYINRTIIHVDRLVENKTTRTVACEGFYTALLEQFILSTCETLILTRSGFSSMAAYIRGTSERLFLYDPKTSEIFKSNLTGIQKVFKHV